MWHDKNTQPCLFILYNLIYFGSKTETGEVCGSPSLKIKIVPAPPFCNFFGNSPSTFMLERRGGPCQIYRIFPVFAAKFKILTIHDMSTSLPKSHFMTIRQVCSYIKKKNGIYFHCLLLWICVFKQSSNFQIANFSSLSRATIGAL